MVTWCIRLPGAVGPTCSRGPNGDRWWGLHLEQTRPPAIFEENGAWDIRWCFERGKVPQKNRYDKYNYIYICIHVYATPAGKCTIFRGLWWPEENCKHRWLFILLTLLVLKWNHLLQELWWSLRIVFFNMVYLVNIELLFFLTKTQPMILIKLLFHKTRPFQ